MNNPIYNVDCFDVGNECSSSDIGIIVFILFALCGCVYTLHLSHTKQITTLSRSATFLITSFIFSTIIWTLNILIDSDWLEKTTKETAAFWETAVVFVIIYFLAGWIIELYAGQHSKQ